MEAKSVAAAALCCMLILLSGQQQQQQQVAGGFCGCFRSCYPECREGNPGWLCTIKCLESCTLVSHEAAVAVFGDGDGDCSKICIASICGMAETSEGPTDAGAAAACVDDCTKNRKRYKNKHT